MLSKESATSVATYFATIFSLLLAISPAIIDFDIGMAQTSIVELRFPLIHWKRFCLLHFWTLLIIYLITTLSTKNLGPCNCIFVIFIDIVVQCTG